MLNAYLTLDSILYESTQQMEKVPITTNKQTSGNIDLLFKEFEENYKLIFTNAPSYLFIIHKRIADLTEVTHQRMNDLLDNGSDLFFDPVKVHLHFKIALCADGFANRANEKMLSLKKRLFAIPSRGESSRDQLIAMYKVTAAADTLKRLIRFAESGLGNNESCLTLLNAYDSLPDTNRLYLCKRISNVLIDLGLLARGSTSLPEGKVKITLQAALILINRLDSSQRNCLYSLEERRSEWQDLSCFHREVAVIFQNHPIKRPPLPNNIADDLKTYSQFATDRHEENRDIFDNNTLEKLKEQKESFCALRMRLLDSIGQIHHYKEAYKSFLNANRQIETKINKAMRDCSDFIKAAGMCDNRTFQDILLYLDILTESFSDVFERQAPIFHKMKRQLLKLDANEDCSSDSKLLWTTLKERFNGSWGALDKKYREEEKQWQKSELLYYSEYILNDQSPSLPFEGAIISSYVELIKLANRVYDFCSSHKQRRVADKKTLNFSPLTEEHRLHVIKVISEQILTYLSLSKAEPKTEVIKLSISLLAEQKAMLESESSALANAKSTLLFSLIDQSSPRPPCEAKIIELTFAFSINDYKIEKSKHIVLSEIKKINALICEYQDLWEKVDEKSWQDYIELFKIKKQKQKEVLASIRSEFLQNRSIRWEDFLFKNISKFLFIKLAIHEAHILEPSEIATLIKLKSEILKKEKNILSYDLKCELDNCSFLTNLEMAVKSFSNYISPFHLAKDDNTPPPDLSEIREQTKRCMQEAIKECDQLLDQRNPSKFNLKKIYIFTSLAFTHRDVFDIEEQKAIDDLLKKTSTASGDQIQIKTLCKSLIKTYSLASDSSE